MMVVTTDYISGKNLEMIGICRGSMVQTKHLGTDILASFKTLVGGEVSGYSEMLNQSRATATQRMIEDAQNMGADAVVNVRYVSAAVMQGAAEITAYGTAVKFV